MSFSLLSSQLDSAGLAIMVTQTVEPYVSTIGDRKKLVNKYQWLAGAEFPDMEIYFNPALFVADGTGFSPAASKPGSYWLLSLAASTVNNTYYDATFTGNNSQKNDAVRWKVNADRTELWLEFSFYATMDIEGYLSSLTLQNVDRLLKNRRTNPVAVDNSGTSVYGAGGRSLGVYLFAEYEGFPEGSATVQYFVDGFIEVTGDFDFPIPLEDLPTPATGVLTVNGVDVATDVLIQSSDPGFISMQALGTYPSPSAPIVFETLVVGGITDVFISITNTEGEASTSLNHYHDFELKFYDEGDFTDAVFSLEREGNSVTTLSSVADTTVNFGATSPASASFIVRFLIKTSNVANTSAFLSAYGATLAGQFPVSEGGGVFSGSLTVPFGSVEEGETYRVVTVWYSTVDGLYGSFISDEYEVEGAPPPPLSTDTGMAVILYGTVLPPIPSDIANEVCPCDFGGCKENEEVFYEVGGEWWKNDKSAFLFQKLVSADTISFELIRNGAKVADLVDDSYGTYYATFVSQPLYKGFVIDWEKVGGIFAGGTFVFRAVKNILGVASTEDSREFRLYPYAEDLIDETVRIETYNTGNIIGTALDYTDLLPEGWYQSFRIPGKFGYKTPTLETDQYLDSDYKSKQIQDRIGIEYELRSKLVPSMIADQIAFDNILANTILLTDYNLQSEVIRRLEVVASSVEDYAHFERNSKLRFSIKFRPVQSTRIKRNF